MTPLVSVVLTTYETEPGLLRSAIESIRWQSLEAHELLVVVDGEPDGPTREVLSQATEDPRVRLIEPGRVGRGRALNIGLEDARSAFVAIQDADDESHPERLERQHRVMATHDRYWVLGSEARFTYADDAHADWTLAESGSAFEVDSSLLVRNSIVHTSVLLRREQILGIGGYSETRASQFDLDLYLRVRRTGGILAKLDVPLVLSRVHAGQAFEFGQPSTQRVLDTYRLQAAHLADEPWTRRLGYRALILARVPARLVSVRRRRRIARRSGRQFGGDR